MGETTVGHVAGEVVRALRGRLYGIHHRPVPQVHQGVGTVRRSVLLQCLLGGFGSVFPQCGLMVFPGAVIVSR